jgi:AraC-like DNA-binding protein
VEYRRAQDALILESTTLLRPLPRFDGGLAEVLDREVETRLSALPRRESVARKAQALMRAELMAEGAPSVDGVAAQLGMPVRTLSRRLRSEGSSFQSVLDGLRLDLADRFLVDSTMTVSEVALALGYSDPSAFNKAFRRWTGQAPHAYRRRRSPTV